MAVSLQQAVPAQGEAKQECCVETELLREQGKGRRARAAGASVSCLVSPPPPRAQGHTRQSAGELVGEEEPALRVTGDLPDTVPTAGQRQPHSGVLRLAAGGLGSDEPCDCVPGTSRSARNLGNTPSLPRPPPRPAIDLTAACALLGGARGAPLTPAAAALSVFPAPASWGAPLLHLPTVLVAFSGVKWPLTVVLICMMASDVERLAR